MPNKSVLSMPDSVAKLPREGFNMSQKLKFTSSTGHILPVYFDMLNPSERIKISLDLFTRTQDISKCAMADIDEFLDVFFVPFHKLYSPFKQLITAVDDFDSSIFGANGTFDIKAAISNSNIIPLFDTEAMIDSASPTYQYFNTLATAYSVYGQSIYGSFRANAVRLFDHLGFNPDPVVSMGDDSLALMEDYVPKLSPAFLLAYQAIYYDYFRLSNWENNRPYAYNVDNVPLGTDITSSTFYQNSDRLRSMFELHFRPFQRDYFKALEPNPLIQSTGILSRMLVDSSGSILYNPNSLDGNNSALGNQNSNPDPLGTAIQVSTYDQNPNRTGLATLRNAYAWQKMLKIQGRAGAHYDDQILAHYGYKVPKGIGNEVYFLGSHHQQIHIGEVISTAATSDAPLGAISGRGYAKAHSNNIDFIAPCHGILMVTYSCVPKPSYITGIDKLHTMVGRYNFPLPEFDNLGMQPLFTFEYFAKASIASTRNGWQHRYMNLKTKYDRTTRAFQRGDSVLNLESGPFRQWTISYRANGTYGYTGLDSLLCTDHELDQIMLQGYTPTLPSSSTVFGWINGLYATDPLIHDLDVTCYKVSWMTKYGDGI